MIVRQAHFLTSTITIPIYGKLGDMVGRKRLFCLSQALFIGGSLICATGSTMTAIIVGRAVQGFGGGGSMILSQAIVADVFPPKERGKYMGIMGAVNYLPTYIQITKGFNATISAYLMVPMMLAVMACSTLSGVLASKKNRIKGIPLCGMVLATVGCAALSTLAAGTSVLIMCLFMFVMGSGIGLAQQLLVLMVQNEYSVKEVGTAASANNFFREIGGTVGATVVGSLFTSNLVSNLQSYTAAAGNLQALGLDANSITPAMVRALDESTRTLVTNAYNDALTPIFAGLAAIMALGIVLIALIKEKPLKRVND